VGQQRALVLLGGARDLAAPEQLLHAPDVAVDVAADPVRLGADPRPEQLAISPRTLLALAVSP
jgi:hypothetical protein